MKSYSYCPRPTPDAMMSIQMKNTTPMTQKLKAAYQHEPVPKGQYKPSRKWHAAANFFPYRCYSAPAMPAWLRWCHKLGCCWHTSGSYYWHSRFRRDRSQSRWGRLDRGRVGWKSRASWSRVTACSGLSWRVREGRVWGWELRLWYRRGKACLDPKVSLARWWGVYRYCTDHGIGKCMRFWIVTKSANTPTNNDPAASMMIVQKFSCPDGQEYLSRTTTLDESTDRAIATEWCYRRVFDHFPRLLR